MISILLKSLRRLKLAKVLLENSIFNWKQKKTKKNNIKKHNPNFYRKKAIDYNYRNSFSGDKTKET